MNLFFGDHFCKVLLVQLLLLLDALVLVLLHLLVVLLALDMVIAYIRPLDLVNCKFDIIFVSRIDCEQLHGIILLQNYMFGKVDILLQLKDSVGFNFVRVDFLFLLSQNNFLQSIGLAELCQVV